MEPSCTPARRVRSPVSEVPISCCGCASGITSKDGKSPRSRRAAWYSRLRIVQPPSRFSAVRIAIRISFNHSAHACSGSGNKPDSENPPRPGVVPSVEAGARLIALLVGQSRSAAIPTASVAVSLDKATADAASLTLEPKQNLVSIRRSHRLSRTSSRTAIPKRAKSGGSSLEGCSQGRSSTGHNQQANSFGPNELRAIATSGDKHRRLFEQGFHR